MLENMRFLLIVRSVILIIDIISWISLMTYGGKMKLKCECCGKVFRVNNIFDLVYLKYDEYSVLIAVCTECIKQFETEIIDESKQN